MVDGERVNLEQCPGDLDMENGDQIDAFAVDHKANSSFFDSRLAGIRGQDLPELGGLFHLEMRERAVRVRDLEVQFFVALGRLGHCIAGGPRGAVWLTITGARRRLAATAAKCKRC